MGCQCLLIRSVDLQERSAERCPWIGVCRFRMPLRTSQQTMAVGAGTSTSFSRCEALLVQGLFLVKFCSQFENRFSSMLLCFQISRCNMEYNVERRFCEISRSPEMLSGGSAKSQDRRKAVRVVSSFTSASCELLIAFLLSLFWTHAGENGRLVALEVRFAVLLFQLFSQLTPSKV